MGGETQKFNIFFDSLKRKNKLFIYLLKIAKISEPWHQNFTLFLYSLRCIKNFFKLSTIFENFRTVPNHGTKIHFFFVLIKYRYTSN